MREINLKISRLKLHFEEEGGSACIFLRVSFVTVLESWNAGECEVADRCFSEEGLGLWVCASLSTLYPLFIESKPG